MVAEKTNSVQSHLDVRQMSNDLCIALMLGEELNHLIDGGSGVSGRELLGDDADVCGGASDVSDW